jgi:predicted MFS family arabinose efflux permease
VLVWGALLNVRDVASIQVLYFLSGVFFTAQAISIVPLIARVSTPAQRPMLFGVNFAVLMATSVVSALIGGRLPQWIAFWLNVDAMSAPAYRSALSIIIGLCCLVIWVLWGLEAQIRASTIANDVPVVGVNEPHIPLLTIVFRSFGRTLLGFAGGVFFPFVNIYLRQQYDMSDATVGTVIAIFAIGATLGGLCVGQVMHYVGSRSGILYAGCIAALSTISVLYPHPWLFTLMFSICTCMVSFIFPLADVLLMGMIAPSQRGMATSVSNMMWSLGWAVAAWLSAPSAEWVFLANRVVSACIFVSGYLVFRCPISTIRTCTR